MAKSKQQKREEALARDRALYDKKFWEIVSWRPGGERYSHVLKKSGEVEANKLREGYERNWGIWLKKVGLDAHGNIVDDKADFLLGKKAVKDKLLVGEVTAKSPQGWNRYYGIENELDDVSRGF